jgi:hypothetical protein
VGVGVSWALLRRVGGGLRRTPAPATPASVLTVSGTVEQLNAMVLASCSSTWELGFRERGCVRPACAVSLSQS